ncbi:hypothetical protein CROQUDRAFT_166757 [Cronartium quercuum f. sp. fusiforme G11]|uniref:Uncharacterized protein n=1 Tax=Cronartium quercuum f. sp. fusiforme G11 TaxID=708437 RepID=A0A9P6NHI1_9BASI|nr:hypothetical protein CROQUDRAFT_166757 [Cronartium quercuum f. sp. fusiforme G11]
MCRDVTRLRHSPGIRSSRLVNEQAPFSLLFLLTLRPKNLSNIIQQFDNSTIRPLVHLSLTYLSPTFTRTHLPTLAAPSYRLTSDGRLTLTDKSQSTNRWP